METKKPQQVKEICRALVSPAEEGEGYDFTAIAVPSNNKQLRYSFLNDEYFYQVLKTGSENLKVERMDSGLPLFDNHPEMEDAGVMSQLGITVGYEITPEGIVMNCKFGARADEALRSDVKNKICKTVSIEGSVLEYLIERKAGEIPTYYAELWEPESLSFAPVPNDISAQIEVKRAIQKQLQMPQAGKSFINKLTNKF